MSRCIVSVWTQVFPLLPCCTQSPFAATETALRNATSSPTRRCHAPRSPEVPTRAWSWPSARNWTASSSMPRTKTPPAAPTDGGPGFFVTASRVTASGFPSQIARCLGTHPAGTPEEEHSYQIMPWVCWSATQWRRWGCCRSHDLTFGPMTPGMVSTAGTSRQGMDSQTIDSRATAEKNVSTC